MNLYTKAGHAETELKWARIWYNNLAGFHRHAGDSSWEFTVDEVIAFLRSKRDQGLPAWKRMSIIRGLMIYRQQVQRKGIKDLEPIREKMGEIVMLERARKEGYDTVEESVGVIDESEPDVIQEFRRALRRNGLALGTERKYVGNVKRFMAERGLTCLADFSQVRASHVEAHLTDLAVDGNVAPSTQNAAFHSLLSLFTLVLKRDMGQIQAIRATKGKQIPTIMSPNEVSDVFDNLTGIHLAIGQLLYGCGMRISEAVRLRVKDLDFENELIQIHQSKGEQEPHGSNAQGFDRTAEAMGGNTPSDARTRLGGRYCIGLVAACFRSKVSVGAS